MCFMGQDRCSSHGPGSEPYQDGHLNSSICQWKSANNNHALAFASYSVGDEPTDGRGSSLHKNQLIGAAAGLRARDVSSAVMRAEL